MSTDWEHIRANSTADHRPNEWPPGVQGISMEGLALIGIHEKDNKLYWDGQEIVTKRVVSLRWFELLLAILAATGTFGVFVLELGKVCGYFNVLN